MIKALKVSTWINNQFRSYLNHERYNVVYEPGKFAHGIDDTPLFFYKTREACRGLFVGMHNVAILEVSIDEADILPETMYIDGSVHDWPYHWSHFWQPGDMPYSCADDVILARKCYVEKVLTTDSLSWKG